MTKKNELMEPTKFDPVLVDEALTSVFPQTQVQRCLVPLVRNSLNFVGYQERKAVRTQDDLSRADRRGSTASVGAICTGMGENKIRSLKSWRTHGERLQQVAANNHQKPRRFSECRSGL